MSVEKKIEDVFEMLHERKCEISRKEYISWINSNMDYVKELSLTWLADSVEVSYDQLKEYTVRIMNGILTGSNEYVGISNRTGESFVTSKPIIIGEDGKYYDGSHFGSRPNGNRGDEYLPFLHLVNVYGNNREIKTKNGMKTQYDVYKFESIKKLDNIDLIDSKNPEEETIGVISGKIVSITTYKEKEFEDKQLKSEIECQLLNGDRNQLVMDLGIKIESDTNYFTTVHIKYQKAGVISWLGYDTEPIKNMLRPMLITDDMKEYEKELALSKQLDFCEKTFKGKSIQVLGFIRVKESTKPDSEIDYFLNIAPTLIKILPKTNTNKRKQSVLEVKEKNKQEFGEYTKKVIENLREDFYVNPAPSFSLTGDPTKIRKTSELFDEELMTLFLEKGVLYEPKPGSYKPLKQQNIKDCSKKIEELYSNFEKKVRAIQLETQLIEDTKKLLVAYYKTNKNPTFQQIQDFLKSKEIKMDEKLLRKIVDQEDDMKDLI